jgi:hypothetical protein
MQIYGIAPGNDIYFDTGKVRIGNNSPTYNLDVTGDINCSGNYLINRVLHMSEFENKILELTEKYEGKYRIQNKIIKTLIENIGKFQLKLNKLEDNGFKFIED